MASKTIVFTIGDGEVTLEASGFKGGACAVAAKAFEDVLGGPVSNRKLKPEFYQKEGAKLTVGGKQ